jgi:hypothetical protein
MPWDAWRSSRPYGSLSTLCSRSHVECAKSRRAGVSHDPEHRAAVVCFGPSSVKESDSCLAAASALSTGSSWAWVHSPLRFSRTSAEPDSLTLLFAAVHVWACGRWPLRL